MTDPGIRLLLTPEQLRELDRCTECGWHPPTQNHHPNCPTIREETR